MTQKGRDRGHRVRVTLDGEEALTHARWFIALRYADLNRAGPMQKTEFVEGWNEGFWQAPPWVYRLFPALSVEMLDLAISEAIPPAVIGLHDLIRTGRVR